MGCFAGKEVDPSRTGYDIRCVRPFTINSECTVEVRKDSKLYRDQNLDQTSGGLRIINDQVSLESIQSNPRNLIDQFNAETTKVTQNFYLTSFFGLKMRFIKVNRINLLINASIDLPMVTFYRDEKIETLRVPITVKEPQTLERYLDDVVDKIHENYLKNGNTLLYCHDGATNSVALAIGYLLKHTDLQLSEAILHLKYIRKGFENSKCNLYGYKKYIYRFASKFDKNDIDPGTPCKSEVDKNQTREKVASTKKKSKSGTKKRKTGRKKSKSASKKKKAKKNKSKSGSTKSHKSKSGSTKSKKSGTNSSKKQKAMLRRLTAS